MGTTALRPAARLSMLDVPCLLVGLLAMKAGVGKKVEWDGPNMRCTNLPGLNQLVKRECRKGWEL